MIYNTGESSKLIYIIGFGLALVLVAFLAWYKRRH